MSPVPTTSEQRPRRGTPGGARTRRAAVALAALLLAATSCGGEAGPRCLSAVLVTLDTTRVDGLSSYGRFPDVTPHLDALAAEGVRYLAAYTVVPITLPSHASMLTGLYPVRHGVRNNGMWPLPEEAETLAERAAAAGVQTAAFVGAIVLDESFGLDQGFERYDVPARGPRGSTFQFDSRSAAAGVDAALAWLRERDRERPFLLWLHFFDPHAPYEPPPGFTEATGNEYLGEIAYVDRELGRLFDALAADGTLDETFLMVVADHGEALGEHDETTHGSYCYESTLRVPLILRYPDGYRAGETSLDVVSVVDVFPTLLEALGLQPPPGIDGQSLFRRTLDEDRGVYFETYEGFLSFGWSPQAGWLDRHGKYIHSSEPQFFDPRRDPAEVHDLAPTMGSELDRYRRAIGEVAARPALTLDTDGAIDDEVLQGIQDLGYAGLGDTGVPIPHPLEDTGLPGPATMAPLHAQTLRAMALFQQQRYVEAGLLFEDVLEQHPRAYLAIQRYAICLMRQGRHAEAVEPLRRMLRERPYFAASHYNLAKCLDELGRTEEALESYARASAAEPGEPLYVEELIDALERVGRGSETATHRRRLAELRARARSG